MTDWLSIPDSTPIVVGAAEVVHRPGHQATVALVFRAMTSEPGLLPHLLELLGGTEGAPEATLPNFSPKPE